MTNSKKRWMIGIGSLAAIGLGWANRRLLTVNDVTTGESHAYPELRSRVYYADPGAVLLAAEQAIKTLSRWTLERTDTENEALDCEVQTRLGGFTDDVTVYVTPLGHGQTRAVIRSRSRVGRGDLGQNAAHIRELQDAMDAYLTADAAF